ncbi:substrate-binding domain-containing protein [Rhodococcus chondri]|uniref:Substrate-binding domain-containing protein n=1 Tax=Rhodococcus chondri TaxID=3065941 RepID=A0ABU7JY32_9NOCA|nr:substrate-binding domain-containing protein [Rhodococcus sp. CC-R104]MEE2034925.1 substrate-binding domain-containing protein [Rhodococcus sp. CC-R104]
MGRHRGADGARGISKGPVIALVAILLLVLATLGWFRLRDRIDDQATRAAETCVEGDTVLTIAADPLIAPTLTALADRWSTEAKRVVRDHCVTAQVTASETSPTAAALGPDTAWNTALGAEPALWVPFDSRAIDRAAAVDGQRRPIATSPIVLAVPTDLHRALTAAATSWYDLPALQRSPAAMTELGLDNWGTLRLALPTGARTDATASTLDAVATAASGTAPGPLTVDRVTAPPSVTAITELALGANLPGTTAGPTTADALDALAAEPGPGAPLHAVPVTEKQLHDTVADNTVAGFLPGGAAPIADFPAVVVDAPWVDETLARAAAEFVDYLRRPEQVRAFTDAGFRGADPTQPGSGTEDQPPLEAVLAPAPPDAADMLLTMRINPVPPRKTTVLVDTSRSMSATEGDGTRLANTSTSLKTLVDLSPNSSVMGLYVFSDGTTPFRQSVARDGLTAAQRTALTTALGAAVPTSAEPVYEAILGVYTDAVENYDRSRPNSVLVILDSDNDDGTTGRELLDRIDELVDPDRPVPIDIVVLGDTVTDTTDLQALTDLTEGSFNTVASTEGTDLTDTLRKLMS